MNSRIFLLLATFLCNFGCLELDPFSELELPTLLPELLLCLCLLFLPEPICSCLTTIGVLPIGILLCILLMEVEVAGLELLLHSLLTFSGDVRLFFVAEPLIPGSCLTFIWSIFSGELILEWIEPITQYFK